jgi:hypothetical protein
MSKNQTGNSELFMGKYFFRASAEDFKKIPASPIAYWLGNNIFNVFKSNKSLSLFVRAAKGLVTANNQQFVRQWTEVSFGRIAQGIKTRADGVTSKKRWFPYTKGGEFRRWYGNLEFVVDWENDGHRIQTTLTDDGSRVRATNFNLDRILISGVSWTVVTMGKQSFRFVPYGFLFDAAAGVCQTSSQKFSNMHICGFLNSKISEKLLDAINPTINLHPGYLESLPHGDFPLNIDANVKALIDKSVFDWDSFEISLDFAAPLVIQAEYRNPSLKVGYQKLRTRGRQMTLEMQRLEEENNRIFIDAYGLQDELSPEVPLNEITLTCNPHYRYGGDKSEEELEALLLADTMRELVSYAVGCMFGRYSLDKPGLILANQGDTLVDYLAQVPQPSFPADEDNVIPMLDGEWFADDVTERFRQFLRVTFGDDHYDENLAFIEQALNLKGKRNYTLSDYMLGDFYADHVKRYKKRPIYWLFSSPKGTFNALIYLHRYRADTASVVLRYLRDFRAKLAARQSTLEQVLINPTTSQGEKTRANKEIDPLKRQIIELQDYENDTLYPLATAQVAIDLDDGVKVNYLKLGAALKKIPGLDAKEED